MLNMPENRLYFTIQTIKGSGLGDQLGTQFSRLYGLGKALGASYIYSSVSFHRSVKPRWHEILQSILFWFRCFIYFVFGRNILSSAVNVLLLRFEKSQEKQLEKYTDTTLSSFLGLECISEGDVGLLTNATFCDLSLDDLFECGKLQTIFDLQFYVASLLRDDTTILRFSWTGKMWGLIPQIDRLLSESGQEKEIIQQSIFSNGFWKQQTVSTLDKINIVFHIRCGDSTTIRLGEHSLIVYDKFLYQSEKEMKEILQIDPDRISVLPEKYIAAYKIINSSFDKDMINLTVISDGYRLTYRQILRNLLKRKCQVILNSSEKSMLWKKIQHKNKIFNQFENAHLIIGESERKLHQSILALANADVVIWGCGGFACNTHSLFKKKNNRSIVVNIKDFSEFQLKQIIKLAHAKSIGYYSKL